MSGAGSGPAETHDRLADLRRRWRATGGPRPQAARAVELLRPTAARVILAFLALLFATAASLAPPPLAKLAIDEGIRPGTSRTAQPRRRRLRDLGARLLGRDLRADLPHRLGRPARAAGPADPALRAPADAVGRLLLAAQAGAIISRLTNDVQALDQLVSDGVVTLFGSTLTLIGTAAILLWLDASSWRC